MRDIVIRKTLHYPIEMVWDALVDPEQLAAWLMPNDFQPEVGHAFTFRTDPAPGFDGIVRSKVMELDAPRRLSWSWVGGGIDTVVTFALAPDPKGTRLTLTHGGFSGMRAVMPRFVLGLGWKSLIGKKLPAHLGQSSAQPGLLGQPVHNR